MSVRPLLVGSALVLLAGAWWPHGIELFIDRYSGVEHESPTLVRWSAVAHVGLFATPAAILSWLAAASG